MSSEQCVGVQSRVVHLSLPCIDALENRIGNKFSRIIKEHGMMDTLDRSLDEFLDKDVSGHCLLLYVSTERLIQCVRHYAACKKDRPFDSSACFVVPKRKGPWTAAMTGFELLMDLPKGTSICEVLDDGQRVETTSKWPLRVYYDAPCPKRLSTMSLNGKFIMQFAGKVAGANSYILLDFAASETFFSVKFAKRIGTFFLDNLLVA